MSSDGLLLTLACAVSWALLDLVRKLLAEGAPAVATTFLLVVGQIPLFALWVSTEGWSVPAGGYWLPGLLTVALNLLANLAFMQSVRLAPMSRTVPLLSLTPVFATLLAIPLLAEWPTVRQAVGIGIVVCAAVLIGAGISGAPQGEPFWRTLTRRGGLLMVVVAMCWSLTPNLDKLAIQQTSPAMHALLVVIGCAFGLAVMAWRSSQLGAIGSLLRRRRALLLALAAVTLGAFATGMQLLAFQQVSVGLVETVKRGVGASLALFFGRLVFSEHIGAGRVLAVAAMVGGVALVILA